MGWREIVRDYFSFSRKERLGILVLLAIIGVCWGYTALLKPSLMKTAISREDSLWLAEANKVIRVEEDEPEEKEEVIDQYVSTVATRKRELFNFDPNTLSEEGWKKLGIREKTVKTILNYVSKGGRFRTANDLQKIYGLRKDDLEAIEPFVRIEVRETQKTFTSSYVPNEKRSTPKVIDINSADTSAFISLPGIGSKLANRIVVFRDKLGGFYSKEQIKEVYGLKDSVFQVLLPYFEINDTQVKKFNINTVTVDELKTHPYFKFALANAIVAYRQEHGSYSSIEDLKKIMSITEEIFNKIRNYITIDN